MDYYPNVSLPSCDCEFQQSHQLLSPPSSTLDDLLSSHNTEVDVSLEWLSVFVEDCLSSTGNCIIPAAPTVAKTAAAAAASDDPATTLEQQKQRETNKKHLHHFIVPSKVRSKRKRAPTTPKNHNNPLMKWSDPYPPLLQQTYWLADSELVIPRKEDEETEEEKTGEKKLKGLMKKKWVMERSRNEGQQQSTTMARRCSHCQSQRTPQWRAGPLGPKTLCNACGVRFKSGRLLPEYRPAKSPSFVSFLHSNSHKKVLEMRNVSSS